MRRFGFGKTSTAIACLLATLSVASSGSAAALPSPERYLPTNTLLFVSVPDWQRFAAQASATPLGQCWQDPALTPFRQKFLAACRTDVVAPLEKNLHLDLGRLYAALSGQATLAVVPADPGPAQLASASPAAAPGTNAPSSPGKPGGIVLLAELGTNSPHVRSMLTGLPPKWTAAGKPARAKKIAGHEFISLTLSSNDLPSAVEQLLSRVLEFRELGAAPGPSVLKRDGREFVIGVVNTALVLASSSALGESVVKGMSDTHAAVLGGVPAFRLAKPAFEDAALYAWADAESIFGMWSKTPANSLAADTNITAEVFKPDRVIAATGFSNTTYVAFAGKSTPDGVHYTLRLGAPEGQRRGVVKLLASRHKDASIPPFVFTDAVEFDRWRVDAREGWTLLHAMFGEISPQWIGSINLILDTANAAARLKDPKFDVQERLFDNLGDDLIIYAKAPAEGSPAEVHDPPSVYLVSSPNPADLAASLQSILIFMTESASPPQQRDYLGTTIFSVPLPAVPLPGGTVSPERQTLHYAAALGYVALTTDVCLLEEFLRAQASPFCSLRDEPGVMEATRVVLGFDPVPGLFGYQNRAARMRLRFETARRDRADAQRNGVGEGLSGAILSFAAPTVDRERWLDYRLLPPFDGIARYFHFTAWSGAADPGGLTWRFFEPTPPALQKK